jgi:hypothetical protein
VWIAELLPNELAPRTADLMEQGTKRDQEDTGDRGGEGLKVEAPGRNAVRGR